MAAASFAYVASKQRNRLRMPAIRDDQLAGIDMNRVQAVMIEEIGDDQAGEPLAETRDRIDGARREFAQHRQALHQLRELLEMLLHGALHAGLAQVEIAQRYQFPQCFFALAAHRQIRDLEQAVGGFSHGRNHHHRLAIEPGFYDAGDTFESRRGFDGRAAEFHDDHQSSSPSEYISSAFNTAAPAAPRTVLCPRAMNL